MRLLKLFLVPLLSLIAWNAKSQIILNVMLPPTGFVEKQQLWNLLITNSGSSTANVRMEVILTDLRSGQPILSASTGIISIPSGTKQLSASNIGGIQYTNISSSYRIDPGPAGLLPIGVFNACYNVVVENGKIAVQDCQQINIEPLSPLLLNLPNNHSVFQEAVRNFSWVPFSSAQFFTQLSYSLKLVEVLPGQNTNDAIGKNPPLFASSNITSNNLFYGPSFPALQPKKLYAWQVTAMNGFTEITKSETWDFSIGEQPENGVYSSNPVYAKLKKNTNETGYAIFFGDIRFEYFNETSDTTWKVNVTDIGASGAKTIRLKKLDTLRMQQGENLVHLPSNSMSGLTDRHIYRLELTNSRDETWQLKFEYRKEE